MGSSATRDRSHGLESLSVIAKVIPADGNSRQVTLHTARGIAALAVCWYHLVMSGGVALSAGLALARYGQFGVEAFFVISGFILPLALWKSRYHPRNFGRFLLKRLARLNPPYLVVVVFCALLTYVGHRLTQTPNPLTWSSLAFHLGYLNVFTGDDWVNPVFWTLAVEMQYYIVLGLVFPLFISSRRFAFYAFVAGCAASQYVLPQGTFLPHSWPAFLMGIAGFRYVTRHAGLWETAAVVTLSFVWGYQVLGAVPAVVGLLTVVAILLIQVRSAITDWLGDISYSLYLLHFPIGVRFVALLRPHVHSTIEAFGLALAGTMVSCLSASVLYRLVELPSQKLASRISQA